MIAGGEADDAVAERDLAALAGDFDPELPLLEYPHHFGERAEIPRWQRSFTTVAAGHLGVPGRCFIFPRRQFGQDNNPLLRDLPNAK